MNPANDNQPSGRSTPPAERCTRCGLGPAPNRFVAVAHSPPEAACRLLLGAGPCSTLGRSLEATELPVGAPLRLCLDCLADCAEQLHPPERSIYAPGGPPVVRSAAS